MTRLHLYNSLTRQKELFHPINPEQVSIYSCGPTVYDRVHVGNLRAIIAADTLQRVLRYVNDYEVRWVMNITDIDDKMIARANERFPQNEPMQALHKLAYEYEGYFMMDTAAVGVEMDDLSAWPHATEYIDEMQALIRALVHDGIAYVVDGSVYFSLAAYKKAGKHYGQLVNIDFDGQARIDDQEQKQGAGDFALWKAAKVGEPKWEFELDGETLPGRPGWHIECSVMSTQLLGREFDIHTGGTDLKFPHHENEIAQCGGVLARYWVHNEHLTIESEKMAKSAGNFVTLQDVGDPLAFRLMVLSGHYRSQMDYSSAALSASVSRLRALKEWASKIVNNVDRGAHDPSVKKLSDAFDNAMLDDINTPKALAVLAEAERITQYSDDLYGFMLHIDQVLGLHLLEEMEQVSQRAGVSELLRERAAARSNKDFARSDKLRDDLRALGVGVEDTLEGQVSWQLF